MKYSFAIIGCGRIATRHAENIVQHGTLAAVCDIVPEKADALAQQYGAKAYYSIEDLLKAETDLDIICICTPNGLHAEHSIKSLQAGKHVLCEKPLCITSVAAWQMIDTAYFSRKKLFVVKQNRYNEPVQLVKQLIDDNKLGKLYSFQINCFWNRPQEYYAGDWKGSEYLDGGVLYTQFSHFIDLLYWFLGEMEDVKGFLNNFAQRQNFHLEDTGVFALKMKNGITGTLHFTINSYNHNKEGSFTLFGEKGTVKIGGEYLNELEWFDVEGQTQPQMVQRSKANDYGFYKGSMSNHDKVYENLMEALQGHGTLLEAKDAAQTITIIEKIYEATSMSKP